jgi:hypothetical protein
LQPTNRTVRPDRRSRQGITIICRRSKHTFTRHEPAVDWINAKLVQHIILTRSILVVQPGVSAHLHESLYQWKSRADNSSKKKSRADSSATADCTLRRAIRFYPQATPGSAATGEASAVPVPLLSTLPAKAAGSALIHSNLCGKLFPLPPRCNLFQFQTRSRLTTRPTGEVNRAKSPSSASPTWSVV